MFGIWGNTGDNDDPLLPPRAVFLGPFSPLSQATSKGWHQPGPRRQVTRWVQLQLGRPLAGLMNLAGGTEQGHLTNSKRTASGVIQGVQCVLRQAHGARIVAAIVQSRGVEGC